MNLSPYSLTFEETVTEAMQVVKEIMSIDTEVWQYLYRNDKDFARQLDILDGKVKEALKQLAKEKVEKKIADRGAEEERKLLLQNLQELRVETQLKLETVQIKAGSPEFYELSGNVRAYERTILIIQRRQLA